MYRNVYDFMYQCGRTFMNARIDMGYTQAELAKKTKLSQQAISRLESGLSNPSISFLYKIATVLDKELNIELQKPPSLEDILNELLGNENP